MNGYKIFDNDWMSHGVQYQLGATTETSDMSLQFYLQALACLQYDRLLSTNHYAEVEAGDVDFTQGKYTTNSLRVVREMTRDEFAALCTGTLTSYEGGVKSYECVYDNGQLHGQYTSWYENGEKCTEQTYERGRLQGLYTSWQEDGTKIGEDNFEQGRRHGLYTSWYANGEKRTEYNYERGQKHGLCTEWYEDGATWAEYNYEHGKIHGLCTSWWESGEKRSEYNYDQGLKHGRCTEWDQDITEHEYVFEHGKIV